MHRVSHDLWLNWLTWLKYEYPIVFKLCLEKEKLKELTTEIEINGGKDFPMFILGFDTIQPGIRLHNIVELKYNGVLVGGNARGFKYCSFVGREFSLSAEPSDVRLWGAD